MKIWYRKSYFYDCSSSIRHKLLQLPLQKAMKCHNLALINNFPELHRLLGSSRKSCALCVCVPPTPKQHCAYLLNCLSSSTTESSGLFWLLGFEMCRLWQTCGISPVLLGKTCLSDCGNSVGVLHHFIHTSFLLFGEVRGLNPHLKYGNTNLCAQMHILHIYFIQDIWSFTFSNRCGLSESKSGLTNIWCVTAVGSLTRQLLQAHHLFFLLF